MAIKSNIMFMILLFFSIIFVFVYKPFSLFFENKYEQIPNIEIFDFNAYVIDDIVKEHIYAKNGVELNSVVSIFDFRYTVLRDDNNIETLEAHQIDYKENEGVDIFEKIKYTHKDITLFTSYLHYTFADNVVSSDKKFEIVIGQNSIVGQNMIYNLKTENFNASNIKIEYYQ